MNSRRERMRMNLEGDRISSLPDDLIAKILSFIGAKQAVETSVLSSRWRFIWTKIPHFNFSSEDFSTLRKFHKFFSHVLSSCNNQEEISLNLHGKVNWVFVKRILNQACSHNLQQLTFTFLDEKNIKCPLSLFSSQSLKELTLISVECNVIPTSMWELPSLTSLHLDYITLFDDSTDEYVGLFSKCTNLKSLTLIDCSIMGWKSFTICHPQLSNLTLKVRYSGDSMNVVAPQLKNLIINNWEGRVHITTPNLTSLLYKSCSLQLSLEVDSLPFLEKVDLCISHARYTHARNVVDLLQKFNTVKYLTLSLEIIELLSTSVEVIASEPSPFVNIRSVKIHPELSYEPYGRKVSRATKVKDYLLDTSSSATFTLVTREEIQAVRDAELAQNFMEELRVLLDLKHKEDKRLQACTQMPLDMWKTESQVHSYFEDLHKEIKQRETKISDIRSLMQCIKDLLLKLPTSNKAELELQFSSLCAEADTVISEIVSRMNAESAQIHMAELRVLLDLEKAAMEKNKEYNRPQPCTKGESKIDSYWADLYEEIRQGKTKTSDIMSLMQRIKPLLIKLPTSDKAELQSDFSSLCAEADNVISEIVNRMKIECDTIENGLVVSFHELVEAAQSSS